MQTTLKIKFSILCALSFFCLFSHFSHAEDKNFFVAFKFQDKFYRVERHQLDPVTFVFNQGAAKKIKMVTLDWPPYIGKAICRQGWVQQFTIAMLSVQGYEITSVFVPWARAIVMAETGNADVLYPEYYIEDTAPSDVIAGTLRREHLALSMPFDGGTIALIKRKGEHVFFTGDLLDLKEKKIGVVRGYQNTPEFDALMDKGFFKISPANNDFLNVNKLLGRRVNLIIGDPSVIFYTLAHCELPEPEKQKLISGLEVVDPVLGYNNLYFAVSKKRPVWQQTLKDLDTGIQAFKKEGAIHQIINNVNAECFFHSNAPK